MSGRRVRVASIDRDATLRMMLARALEARGDAELVADSDGSPSSLDRLVASQPDLVLLDQPIRTTRGTDLLTVLRERCPGATLTLLTSEQGPGTRRAAIAAGAAAVYDKSDLSLALLDRMLADHAGVDPRPPDATDG